MYLHFQPCSNLLGYPRLYEAAEKDMKIYLLMLLIGTILTAVRLTSAPKRRSETLPE